MAEGEGRSLQVRIGAFILAGLGVFLAIVYLLGAQARYFERKYDLIAEFTEVGGLIPGATVRLAGEGKDRGAAGKGKKGKGGKKGDGKSEGRAEG